MLIFLSLLGHDIKESTAASLCALLCMNGSLKCLDLSRNPITESGMRVYVLVCVLVLACACMYLCLCACVGSGCIATVRFFYHSVISCVNN